MTDVVRIAGASVSRGGVDILRDVTWTVRAGERWVLLGPNGAGKTTLLSLLAGRAQPSAGQAEVLGQSLAQADIQDLRSRVGLSSDALAARIPDQERVRDVVLTAAHGVDARRLEHYDDADYQRADALLAAFGMQDFAEREFATLSEGERKRAQLARAFMPNPELVLLDEPGAGLDLAGREDLLAALAQLASDASAPVLVLVTHHVEEIPPGFTHALLLREGAVAAQGELAAVLTADNLAHAYGVPVEVSESSGRWTARRAAAG